jgi:hypothetical protein
MSVDHVVGTQPTPQLQPGQPGADQDHLPCPERLAHLHRREPDRPWAEHDDIEPGYVAARDVEAVQGGARGGDEDAVLEGQLRRQRVQRADVVDGVLGEAAVRGYPGGAVSLGAVAVVEARRVPAGQAVAAAAASAVRLDAHPVAYRELIDLTAGGRHRAGPFVARRELTERRCLREMPVEDLQVGPAGAAHRDPDQHLIRPRPRDTAVDHPDVAGAEQHRRAHHLRYQLATSAISSIADHRSRHRAG